MATKTATNRSDPAKSGSAFAAEAERLTNGALIDEWLALYHPDALAEWIVDGCYERHDGIDAIRPAATLMADLWRREKLRVTKYLLCATDDTFVLSFDGTFEGRGSVGGSEVWSLHEGLVTHHRMYCYLDIRPRASWLAQARVMVANPRIATSILRLERQTERGRL